MSMFNCFLIPDDMLGWLDNLSDEDLRDFIRMFKNMRDANTVKTSFFTNPDFFISSGFVREDKTYADTLRFNTNFPVPPSLSSPKKKRETKEGYLKKYNASVGAKEVFRFIYNLLGHKEGKEESSVDVANWLKESEVISNIIEGNTSLITEAHKKLISINYSVTRPASFTKTIISLKTIDKPKVLDLT